jgi:4-hydroxy-tetrahydrodipicolinate reductase
VPVISGTTGWLEQYDEMVALCTAKNGFHLSSNFSLGVNIFFEINEYLAKMMLNSIITVLKWRKFTILRN